MKKCPKCGRDCEGFKFCPDCGTELKEKYQPRTLEEALTIWANDPENMRKYKEACDNFDNYLRQFDNVSLDIEDLLKSKKEESPTTTTNDPLLAFEMEAKRAAESVTTAKNKPESDELSAFEYSSYSNGTYIITGLKDKNATEIVIPNNVVTIGDRAFQSCQSLKSVKIGNGVTSIGRCAFMSCSSLTSITIPSSVTSIGEFAFESCTSLTSVQLPNSLTLLGKFIFGGCKSLTYVNIPYGVKSIGESAFDACSSLTSVQIPSSVTSIGEYAFMSCSSLTSVHIPGSVTYISRGAFACCDSLKTVYVDRYSNIYDGTLSLPSSCRIIRQ